ncbi:hypothetical protein CWE12_08510 [Aliidiomarina sedimenti]|uniref:B box-type domain-containing protein n=1 Tax=Aliidiomarina sedimenti TaxID=1933879 RepID=A0ABY0BZ73_9GAMM|nr:hypothetical protein [Aliidiomarina sedimenti]RUO29993.1 hypothetical protein CWE12_08510 [Aliidiomarina sedimenti]
MSAWWSDAGPESCPFCEVSYYAECGYYCAECDRPLCASCIVTDYAQRRVLCSQCQAEADAKTKPKGDN